MGGADMAMEELVAYVVLLSLPLWLLIEQLLFLRSNRRPQGSRARSAGAEPAGGGRRVPSGALSAPVKGDMVWPSPGHRGAGTAPPGERGAAPCRPSLATGSSWPMKSAGAAAPAFVLIHGWTCDRSFFAPQAEFFSKRHRVVSVDLRGHGESRQAAGGLPDLGLR